MTQTEAERREQLIEDVEYDFQLALNKGEHYLGNAVINFYLKELPSAGELFISSQAMAVAELRINDKEQTEKEAFQGQKIALNPPLVVVGWNTVTVRYLTPYNKNSLGLHTFTDSKDNQQYLYSQFEVYNCFKVFPSFDQPGLKAKMALTMIVPKEWQAVSNGIETRYELSDGQKGLRIVERHGIEWFLDFYDKDTEVSICDFEQTPKIAPYLYAIIAGPYKVFEDYDPQCVPQRIFVRESLAENMRHETVFGVTKTTVAFYQRSFG